MFQPLITYHGDEALQLLKDRINTEKKLTASINSCQINSILSQHIQPHFRLVDEIFTVQHTWINCLKKNCLNCRWNKDIFKEIKFHTSCISKSTAVSKLNFLLVFLLCTVIKILLWFRLLKNIWAFLSIRSPHPYVSFFEINCDIYIILI